MGGRKCCLPPLLWPPPLQSEFTERQTPPPLAADLYFSSRLLLYTFIKSTFRDGNSVGALHKCLSQRQRWCSTCLHLFPFLLVSPFFSSFSSPPPFFFFFLTMLPILCLFPEYLKKPDVKGCSLIYMRFHWAGRENTHIAQWGLKKS